MYAGKSANTVSKVTGASVDIEKVLANNNFHAWDVFRGLFGMSCRLVSQVYAHLKDQLLGKR